MKSISAARAKRSQGFTLFLVLIILLLLMMLGVTYLRVMRMSTTQSSGSTGNMGPVLARLQSDIQAIVGADGSLGTSEPHDYPWTCARANASCQLSYPYRVKSAVGMGDPRVDDSWLSPIETENGKWAQVTNLYGSFLNYADKYLDNIPVNVNTRARVPADAPAGRMIDGMANNQFVSFQNLDAADPRLVDTDGDGAGDALWFYPPDSLQNDLRYIAAARIIDASGLLNLNTALGEFGQDPTVVGTGTPRKGEGAYEIDARPLLGDMPAAAKTFRQGGLAAGPSGRAPGNWSNWDYHWASGGRTTDTGDNQSANRYGEEAKLRDHFNNYVDDGKPESQIWRDYPSLGSNAGNRKYVTTVGGARDVRPQLPLKTSQALSATTRPGDLSLAQASEGRSLFNNGSVDVKFLSQQAGNTGASVASLVAAGTQTTESSNKTSLHSGSFNGEYPYPTALQKMCPTGSATSLLWARQMNACWADALDRDNAVTVDGAQWMGWEPLPILTEFYAQMPYFVCENKPSYSYAPTTAGSTGGNYSVYYINTTKDRSGSVGAQYNQTSHDAGLGSYAFEVANPYAVPIRLTNVRFVFGTQSNGSSFDASANIPLSTSQSLDAYVNAAPPAGMAKDAEGHHVLKPGEKIVFYRNGTGAAPGAASPSAGATSDISGLIDVSDGKTYKIDLGTAITGATAAPDINGHYGSRNWEHFVLQCRGQGTNGSVGAVWYPYNRMSYNSLPTASTALPLRCLNCERNVPAGRQGAPGDLVYQQVGVRTFGVEQKLNLLQARPPVAGGTSTSTEVIADWGDMEYRSNLYATVGSGVLSSGGYPPRDSTANQWWHTNSAATKALNPNWMAYDTSLPTLGKSVKVSFPGPNGGNAMYGVGRQSIADEALWFNYVGIPGDAAHPGTFPELTVAGSAMTQRDNSSSASGASRADGIPRVLDLLRAPFFAPNLSTSYRGDDALINPALRNTLGDAVNFFLVSDAERRGIGSLRLRTDIPWFDTSSAAKVAQYAPALPYDSAISYVIGQEAFFGGDIYAAQQTGTLPDPIPANVGPVGSGKQWAYSNGPFARASQCWQNSFAEVLLSRFQVDSPKYKGDTGVNGDNWKPGAINLNTAPKAVLMCLSVPAGTLSAGDADRIIASRKAPASGVSAAGGARKGLVLASEAFGPLAGLSAADAQTLSWLPQQATCRSDAFIAYIVVQGYRKDNFNLGPVEVARRIMVMTRDGTGSGAALIGGSAYSVPLK